MRRWFTSVNILSPSEGEEYLKLEPLSDHPTFLHSAERSKPQTTLWLNKPRWSVHDKSCKSVE
jgi:hypothetical protein